MRFSSVFAAALVPMLSTAHPKSNLVKIPNTIYNGTVEAEFASVSGGFDGPKISPRPNDTSFDWWYFDAVSTSSTNESISVVFYVSGKKALVTTSPKLLYIDFSGSFANGTLFKWVIDATDDTTIIYGEDGVYGEYKGTGLSFSGTSLASQNPTYTVKVNNPELGLHGSLKLRSRAPAHYPCAMNVPGVSEEIIPHIGWSNAVPDALAYADFTIGDTKLKFKGAGYHDKNWGTIPLDASTQSWYWGHASLGPYSAVWFDTRTPDGKEYYSGYVAKDGRVIQKSCAVEAVKVRPFGNNSEYPPVPESGIPDGFTIRYDLGDEGILALNVSTQLVVFETTIYQRYIGPISGGIEGGKQYKGKSLFEQFKYPM